MKKINKYYKPPENRITYMYKGTVKTEVSRGYRIKKYLYDETTKMYTAVLVKDRDVISVILTLITMLLLLQASTESVNSTVAEVIIPSVVYYTGQTVLLDSVFNTEDTNYRVYLEYQDECVSNVVTAMGECQIIGMNLQKEITGRIECKVVLEIVIGELDVQVEKYDIILVEENIGL